MIYNMKRQDDAMKRQGDAMKRQGDAMKRQDEANPLLYLPLSLINEKVSPKYHRDY